MFMCYIKGEELGLSQDHAAAVSCEPSTTPRTRRRRSSIFKPYLSKGNYINLFLTFTCTTGCLCVCGWRVCRAIKSCTMLTHLDKC